MSPRRPRRRARAVDHRPGRSSCSSQAVVVLAVLVGGLTQVSRQSQGYDANSNRLACRPGCRRRRPVQRHGVRGAYPRQRPAGSDPADDSGRARRRRAADRRPGGAGGTRRRLVPVRVRRRRVRRPSSPSGPESVAELRTAIDGFLGMQPMATAGAPATGACLRADHESGDVALGCPGDEPHCRGRRTPGAFGHASTGRCSGRSPRRTGHARLPRSVWVTNPQLWQAGNVAAQVDLMATSPTLAATHYVVLRTVRLDPPALPTPPGAPATVSAISPTTQIGVTAGARQRRLGQRAARRPSASPWRTRRRERPRPASSRPPSPWAPRSRCRPSASP